MKSPVHRNIVAPMPALLKRFALIYLPVVLVLSVALLSGMRHYEQTRLERIELHEAGRIEIARERLAKDFNAATADVRILARLPLLRSYLDSGNPELREDLERLFLLLSQETRRYDKMRYLDASGQEVIRINYNDGKPAIVPQESMQKKGGRYFFIDTLRLDADEIYVSPLDLNVEQDRLEIPHKPAIRFGTPVFDSKGVKKGIILLNYFGEELRRNFREVMNDDEQRSSMLLNRDGYWLSSDRHEDEWGFMLGKDERTFGHDFPAAWRAISANEQGTLLTDQGLFAYSTFYPLLPGQHSSTGSTVINAPSQKELLDRECHWKIVSFVPQELMSDAAFYNQPGSRIALVMVYLLLALAAVFAARISLIRQQAERELMKARITAEGEKKFHVIFEGANDGIALTDAQSGLIENCNAEFERQSGRPLQQLKTLHIWELRPPEMQEAAKRKFDEAKATGYTCADLGFQRPDGTTMPAEIHATRARIGERDYLISISRDITERKQAEQALRDTLAEKEVMMREIHHRVKNNMQMISALLELQSVHVKDEQARALFNDSQQRIQSMAMVHEQIYHNKNMASIDFAAYLGNLVSSLRGQYEERCKQVNIHIDAQACILPVDCAIPCGLVVNELVTNAMKHAFPDGRAGELHITLQCADDGRIKLEIADDGIGMPAGLGIHNSKTFGLQVLALMVEKQLHGRMSVESNFKQGTRVVCEFGGQNEQENICGGRRCADRKTIAAAHRRYWLPIRRHGG